ncbi:MAG: permease-like cell division protein FtsX [Betaproteobacteria bacterium]|nr:permease-like cell division protein FtsX [Betaproteobacteria bacterium]
MISWGRTHLRTVSRVVASGLKTPWSSALTCLVIGVTLSFPAGLYTLLRNVQSLAGTVHPAPQINLYLRLDDGPADIGAVNRKLARLHGQVEAVRFVSKAAALKAMEAAGGAAAAASSLPANPLPDAFIVTARSPDPQALRALKGIFQSWPEVDQVQLDFGWAKRLAAFLRLAREIVALTTVLLGATLVAVVGNTIRLQILTQRDEIEVAWLMGATRAFIRRPFLYYGVAAGLLGGVVSWLIVRLSIALLEPRVATLAALYGSGFRLMPPSPTEVAMLLLFSAGLGCLGAYLAVMHYLRR